MRAERLKERLSDPRAVRASARAPRWVIPFVRAALVVADIALAAFSFLAAFYIREGVSILQHSSDGSLKWSGRFAPYAALLPFILPIRLLALYYLDLYRLRGEFSFVEDGVKVFKATAIGSLLIVATAFMYRGVTQYRAFSYARGVFVLDFFIALAAFGLVRLIVRSAQTFVRRRDINLIPTLVVGRGPEAALCIKEMRERPSLGYRVIGVVENGAIDESVPTEFEGVPVISGIEGLPDAIRESRANEVIITDPKLSGDVLFDVMMRVGRGRGVEFRIAPSLFNCLPRKTEIDQIGALPMIRLFREPLSRAARIVKRASDIIIASGALAILSPLWLLIALVIKLDSRGPIFYKQERVGMDGRIFLFYKFRTMRVDANDEAHREYQRKYIAGRAEAMLVEGERPAYKLVTDPRITRIGRWLRRLSFDELPQLLNVLRGDMSVVGPRPPIPYEVEAYALWHRKRLDMKPGLTGLWQVSGRNRLPFDEMVRLDLFYIENWSLLLDLKIILRTLPVMLRGDDAY
ncbi:MAG TPA: sugar transferase [Pyrinomonadaceae bacterium]|nr:sugar transferase [Pyrinomonadaceae bacterium]